MFVPCRHCSAVLCVDKDMHRKLGFLRLMGRDIVRNGGWIHHDHMMIALDQKFPILDRYITVVAGELSLSKLQTSVATSICYYLEKGKEHGKKPPLPEAEPQLCPECNNKVPVLQELYFQMEWIRSYMLDALEESTWVNHLDTKLAFENRFNLLGSYVNLAMTGLGLTRVENHAGKVLYYEPLGPIAADNLEDPKVPINVANQHAQGSCQPVSSIALSESVAPEESLQVAG